MSLTDRIGDMSSCLTNEFQIPQRGIVGEGITDERVLIHSIGKGLDFLGEFNHVIHVETPFLRSLSVIRHE